MTAGKVPTIAVKVEKRMGKKLVTILHGLEGLGIDPAAFAKEAQKRFACAASVNTAVGGHGGEKVRRPGLLSCLRVCGIPLLIPSLFITVCVVCVFVMCVGRRWWCRAT